MKRIKLLKSSLILLIWFLLGGISVLKVQAAREISPEEIVSVSNKKEFYEALSRQIKEQKKMVYYDTYENAVGVDFQKAIDEYYFHHDIKDLMNSGSYWGRYIKDGHMESWHGNFSDDHNCQIKVQLEYKYDKEELDAYWKEMKTVAGTLKKESDYESVKAVHDYIISHYDYDDSHKNYLDYEGYRDGIMVCQGYCMATFLLLSEMGIPVRIVTGASKDYEADPDHAWNVVMVDGQWYNMDVTWDDQGSRRPPDYTFFLKSDADFYKHTREGWYDYDKDMALVSYTMPNRPGLGALFVVIAVIVVGSVFMLRRHKEMREY